METHVILTDEAKSFLHSNTQEEIEEGRFIETLRNGEAVVLQSYVLKNNEYVHEQGKRTVYHGDAAFIICDLVDDNGKQVV